MSFQPFQPVRKSRTQSQTEPQVSIRKNGVIHLNAAAYDMLNEPEWVTFYMDADGKQFGIRAVAEKIAHEYVIKVRQPNPDVRGYDINAQVFTDANELVREESVTYEATFDIDWMFLVVHLDRKVEVEVTPEIAARREKERAYRISRKAKKAANS